VICHQPMPSKIRSSKVCDRVTTFGTFGSICARNGDATCTKAALRCTSGSVATAQISLRPRRTAGTDSASARFTFTVPYRFHISRTAWSIGIGE
jgi:hypothetical protein